MAVLLVCCPANSHKRVSDSFPAVGFEFLEQRGNCVCWITLKCLDPGFILFFKRASGAINALGKSFRVDLRVKVTRDLHLNLTHPI